MRTFRGSDPDVVHADARAAEVAARADHAEVAGTTILVDAVDTYNDENDIVTVTFSEPAKVTVATDVPDDDIVRWTDHEHLDPYWTVEVDPANGEFPAESRDRLTMFPARTHRVKGLEGPG